MKNISKSCCNLRDPDVTYLRGELVTLYGTCGSVLCLTAAYVHIEKN